MKIRNMALAAAVVVSMIGTSALAQTKTGQFAVRASVNTDCRPGRVCGSLQGDGKVLATRDLDFGVYVSNANSRVNTSLDVKCTQGSAVAISLDAGNSGNAAARLMVGPGPGLGYQLYKDTAYSQAISTTGTTFQLTSAQNTGATVTYTLYGQIPSGQSVASGNYTDTVRVTLSY